MYHFANHILLATLGITVASLFSEALMESPVNSYCGLALTIVLSIAALGIHGALPTALKNITWVIPPAVNTQQSLMNWSGENLGDLSIFPFIWIIIYSILLLILFLKLAKS